MHVPKPPSSAGHCKEMISNKVTVRKLKPQAELDKPRTKRILIAKPAPPYTPLKPEDSTGTYYLYKNAMGARIAW